MKKLVKKSVLGGLNHTKLNLNIKNKRSKTTKISYRKRLKYLQKQTVVQIWIKVKATC